MTNPRRQNAQLRKPEILRAFSSLIAEQGLEKASIAKVAGKAGIHPSLVIHYFGTRQGLILALVDQIVKDYARLFAEMPTTGTADERLTTLLETLWGDAWETTLDRAVFFAILTLATHDDEVRQKLSWLYGQFRTRLEHELRSIHDQDGLSLTDPAGGAEILMTMLEGSLYFRPFICGPEQHPAHTSRMITAARAALSAGPA